MFDLHTHSLLSDGELLPSELARRYEEKGFRAIAITDHADVSFNAESQHGRVDVETVASDDLGIFETTYALSGG